MLPYITYYWLVVDLPTPPKNMKVNWDYDIPNMEKMFQTTNQITYYQLYTL